MNQVMISLKPAYGELMLSGSKTVELRNRIVRIEPCTKVWIYVKVPVGKIIAQADVKYVIHGDPHAIWSRYHKGMRIDWVQFQEYVGDRDLVSAIVLDDINELPKPISIVRIRRVVRAFQPPQFYLRIAPDSGLFRILNNGIELREDGLMLAER